MWKIVGDCGRIILLLIKSEARIDVNHIIGVYVCKLDAKGRATVPAGLKRQLMAVSDGGFVIKRSIFSRCLELHTQQEWDKVSAQVGKLNRFVKKNADFVRMFHAGVKLVDMDAAGRILIPKDLLTYAGLEGNIVFSATTHGMEIWNQEDYERELNRDDLDFGALAEEVMGSQGNQDDLS